MITLTTTTAYMAPAKGAGKPTIHLGQLAYMKSKFDLDLLATVPEAAADAALFEPVVKEDATLIEEAEALSLVVRAKRIARASYTLTVAH